jgi:hypothetical protein
MNNEMQKNNNKELDADQEQITEEDLAREIESINEKARQEIQEQLKKGLIKYPKERKITEEEQESVKEIVRKALTIGIWPIKSISLQDVEIVKEEGIQETPGWDKRWKLACTILRDPLDKVTGEEDRGFFEIPNLEEKDVTPRFTGPEKLFEGIVCLNNGVPPDKIRFKGYSADLKKEKGDEK